MDTLVITPKSKSEIPFLQKLLSQLDSVREVKEERLIEPAENPDADPCLLFGKWRDIKSVEEFRSKAWKRS